MASRCEYIDECPLGVNCSNPKLEEFGTPDAEVLIVKSVPAVICDVRDNLYSEEADTVVLSRHLAESGIMDDRSKVAMSSLIRCGINRKDTKLFGAKNKRKAIELCGQHMEQTLARLTKLKLIIPLGSEARDYFCQDKLTITKSLGRKYTMDYGFGSVAVIPNMSPTQVAYDPSRFGAKYLSVFKKADRELKGNLNKSQFKTKFLPFTEFRDYAERLLSYYKEGKIDSIAFDVETSVVWRTGKDSTSVDIQDPNEYITGFSLADEVEDMGYYVNLYHPRMTDKIGETRARIEEKQTQELLLKLLHTIPFYAHNSKYDLTWSAKKLGLDLRKITLVDDTLTLAYLLIGVKRDTGIGLNLKELCKMYFEIDEDWDEPLDIEFAKFNRIADRRLINVDFNVLSQYGAMDTIAMLHLRKRLKEEMQKPNNIGMLWSYKLLLRATVKFAEIERPGVPVNAQMLDYLDKAYNKQVKKLHSQFNNLHSVQEFYKYKIREREGEWDDDVIEEEVKKMDMPARGKLIIEFFYDFLGVPVKFETKKGAPSLNVDAKQWIAKHAPEEHQREAMKLLAEEIEVQNQISKYIKNIKAQHDKYGGYFPTYNLTSVATGRLSSDFHLLPSFGDIKYNFVSKWSAEGGVVMAPDYSQVEVRVFASLSGDPDLKQAYIDGLDIHKFVASQSFHVAYEDVTKTERSKAKAIIFGMLYGQSVYTLAENLGVEVAEAQEIQDSIFKRFPKIKMWVDKTIKDGSKNGYVDSALGRRRQLPGLIAKYKFSKNRAERMKYSTAVRAAMNHPIQSTASDVTLSSIVELHEGLWLEAMSTYFLGTVHDSMELDVHPAEIVDTMFLVKNKCEDDLQGRFDWLNGVPYRMDLEMGMSWGSCCDVEIESHDPDTYDTVLELSGRDIGIQRLQLLFSKNSYLNMEVLHEEKVEEKPDIDYNRVFNGLIYKTSKYKVTQKVRITKTPKYDEYTEERKARIEGRNVLGVPAA